MPEFFLELFSEEIPARMQAAGAVELGDLCAKTLAALNYDAQHIYYGPRRIAVKSSLAAVVPARKSSERGPRLSAPEQALAGFLRKHDALREDLVQEGDFWVLNKTVPEISARDMILDALPKALSQFRWPKSMRWGQGGDFAWVRPLRRMVCLLDGEVVPVKFGPITAGSETEGHRIHGPGPVAVFSAAIWEERLREHDVIVDQEERRRKIAEGIAEKAEALGLTVALDDGLLDEVTGLVEWPVPLIGKIDEQFMDLPPEVRELSMKVNQKYFALRDREGNSAPYFAFVANLEAPDGGAAIIAGNERVLRARLSDARYFWDTDLKIPLNEWLPKLQNIVFHSQLGTQWLRSERIARQARKIAEMLGADERQAKQAEWAGRLSKADLVTGMVGEFPELQGIIGGYYAELKPSGWNGEIVGTAIKSHYRPKGPSDAVPTGIVPVSVALADKLDTLNQFFTIGETPTGSGDPYALRRAALGVIRIIIENELKLPLKPLIDRDQLFDFIIERLRVKLRSEGKRFDVLDAVLSAREDDDLIRILRRVTDVTEFLETEDGQNLLVAYRRAANILKIEDAKDGPHLSPGKADLCILKEEEDFYVALNFVVVESFYAKDGTDLPLYQDDKFIEMLGNLSRLRKPVDAFFDHVTVNDPDPRIRLNRLQLLARFRDITNRIADFSKIEG